MAKDAEWSSLMNRSLFKDASDEGSATLGHLTALYVERHYSLWKVPLQPPSCSATVPRACSAAPPAPRAYHLDAEKDGPRMCPAGHDGS